jgi:hypothetical protein
MPHDIELAVPSNDLHLREYDSIKAELLENVKNLSAQLQYAIAISAVLFSWIFTHRPVDHTALFYIFAGCIPTVVTAIFYQQTRSAFFRIDDASSFAQEIEDRFSIVGSFEARIHRQDSDFRKALRWSWAILFIFDILVAIVAPALSFIGKA